MKDCTFIDLYNYDKDYLIGYNRFYDFRKKKKVELQYMILGESDTAQNEKKS